MSAPIVPQRPARSQDALSPGLDVPEIPPRPARNTERSTSPARPVSVRSPLNDSPFAANVPAGGGMTRPSDRLTKVPSVPALPLVGQEGMEYACLGQGQAESATTSPTQPEAPNETRNISGDLPMHAPKASMASAAARAQVAPMTRIDSTDAAGAGIGKPHTEYDESELPSRAREYRPSSSLSRELTRSTSRPESFHSDEHDHGIPAIGLQVPMNPNAGDVQAPSPGPSQHGPSTGVGFFNSGGQAVSPHGRRRSLGFVGPPGSYGLHGHGLIHKDQFEKSWYQKHPEELTKEEQGAYGPSMGTTRSQWAMSSDDLNKLVRDTANRHVHGTAPPDEDFGYKLSEEYSSKNSSPQLKAVKSRTASQTYAESPLRNASFPEEVGDAHTFDSENEDDQLHLGPPRKISMSIPASKFPHSKQSDPADFSSTAPPANIYKGTPALASDEVSKGHSHSWTQPAVSPLPDNQAGDDYFGAVSRVSTQNRSARNSRPNSRPSSARFHHHDLESIGTPLDEIEEYEPLFNDEDDVKAVTQRPLTAAERAKRAELKRRFPSMDIWEDTPTSLQLHTTVSAPQEPEETSATSARAGAGPEAPEKGQTRPVELTEVQKPSYLQDEMLSKSKFKPGVEEEMQGRPSIQRRFPSRDVWEDTPASLRLETTISEAEARELAESGVGNEATLKNQDSPVVPSRPVRSKEAQAQPAVPPRPQRAKPQIPPRPIKTSQDDSGDGSNLDRTTSAGSTGSNEVTSPTDRSATTSKTKPVVPSKPQVGSSKFASIKAGFMNDLNSRLQQGPQAKKPEQPEAAQEEDKAPLLDARKGRARGPVRRRPAEQSPSDLSAPVASSSAGWSIVQPLNMWSISNTDSDDVIVGAPTSSSDKSSSQAPDSTAKSKPTITPVQPTLSADAGPVFSAPPLATNTAGEYLAREGENPTISSRKELAAHLTVDEHIAPVSPLATNTAGESLSKTTVGYPEPTQQDFQDTSNDSAKDDLSRSTEVLDTGAEGDAPETAAPVDSEPQVSN